MTAHGNAVRFERAEAGIVIRDLAFAYPTHRVFTNLSFEVGPRTLFSILGPSGCGKTTLLRLVAGLLWLRHLDHCEGEITIFDQYDPIQFRRLGKLALVFQEPTLLPHLTVLENVRLPLVLRGKVNDDKPTKLIEKMGLADFAHYLPSQLSGGMRARVGLARGFVTEPKLILLDEPFTGLDFRWRLILYDHLLRLKAESGATVIMVTHNIEEALLLSEDVMILNAQGQILSQTRVREQSLSSLTIDDVNDELTNLQATVNSFRRQFVADTEQTGG